MRKLQQQQHKLYLHDYNYVVTVCPPPPPPPQQTGVKCLTHTIKTVIRSPFIQIFAILMKVN